MTTISALESVHIKGIFGDYKDKKVVGEEFAGKLEIIKFENGKSTSSIIKIIQGL